MRLFRDLTLEEEQQFRAWARANYKAFEPIDGTWHPVIQHECAEINRLADVFRNLPPRPDDPSRRAYAEYCKDEEAP